MTAVGQLAALEEVAQAGEPVRIWAEGIPVPKGSVTAFVDPRTKRVIVKADAGPRLTRWALTIRKAARLAMRDRDVLQGPVRVDAVFRVPRLEGHFGTGRNAGQLKPAAPPWWECTSGGDLDKLLRAVLDPMTDVVYGDDRQVAQLGRVWKVWAGPRADGLDYPAGVWIEVAGLVSGDDVQREG